MVRCARGTTNEGEGTNMKGRTQFFLASACVVGATAGAGAVAVASGGGDVIRACANNKTGALSLQMPTSAMDAAIRSAQTR